MKRPLDPFPYERDPRSREIRKGIKDGSYVYVRDPDGTIYVLPDGLHMHPKVLGNCKPAIYAGDMTIFDGKIKDLTNLSGTFQFSDEKGLLDVAKWLEENGFEILLESVRIFSYDDNSRPRILR
jgi:hypothetical protein